MRRDNSFGRGEYPCHFDVVCDIMSSINVNLTNRQKEPPHVWAAVLFQQIMSRKSFRVSLEYEHKGVNRNG